MSGLPAARKGDTTEDGGLITDGSHNVLINNRPAARIGDPTEYGGPIVQGSLTVLFNNRNASRITDETLFGGPITSGSPNVLIGTQGGVACSVCPGGVAASANPVNPQLGAKVLLGEEDLDFALPGPMPVIWQRQYSSYVNAEHGAACGLLGHGWHLLTEVTLELRENTLLLHDAAGRTITFEEPMPPGKAQYSRSEDIRLLRGGQNDAGELPLWRFQKRFAHINEELAGNANCIIAASGTLDVLWLFTPTPVAAQAPAKPVSKAAGKKPAHEKTADNKTAKAAKPDEAAPGQLWRLTAQIDRFGRTQSYQYSEPAKRRTRTTPPEGKLLTITDGMGRRYRLHHQRIHPGKDRQGYWHADDGWRLVSVELDRDPLGRLPEPVTLVRYGYNRQGQLTSVHDRAGELAREFEWAGHRISAHRIYGGPWHRYRYSGTEPDVRVAANTNEQGLDYTFEYRKEPPTPKGKPRHSTVVTDSLKRTETYRFEGDKGLSRLTEHHRADGSVMRYQYDGFGRRYAAIDPLGRTTFFRLNGSGELMGTQRPDNSRTSQTLEAGYVTESQDPSGAITGYQYDEYKRLTQVTLPDGSTERYHYPDPKELPLVCGQPIRIEDARGGKKQLAYNDAGQLTRYTDCSGRSTEWEYDRWGDLIKVTDAQERSTRYKRDAAGRIIETQLPNNQVRRYQYDKQGNLIRVEPDENNPASALEIGRDPWGRPLTVTQGGLSVKMEYDAAGRLSCITNENGAQSRFIWDALDRLVQETGFDGRVQRYGYDQAGQLGISGDGTGAEQTDLVTRYRYDLMGRLIEQRIPAPATGPEQIRRYEWDKVGRLMAASVTLNGLQPQGSADEQLQNRIQFERDKLGRVTAEMQRLYQGQTQQGKKEPPVEWEHRIAHQLDALGNRLHSDLQHVGQVQWLRYGAGHVHGLMHEGQTLIDFERDGLHRETSRTLNGAQQEQRLTLERWYDSLGRLEGIRLQGLAAPNLTAIPSVLVGQMESRRYRYDNLSQMVGIDMPEQVLGFGYDGAGRLRSQATYDPDEYLRATAGNAKPRETLHWDVDPAGNRMPRKLTGEHEQRQYWAELAHRNWQDAQFNLLGQNPAKQDKGPRDKWLDNRIGYFEDHALRYDLVGNRTEQFGMKQDSQGRYQRQRYSYDGANQLAAVEVDSIVGRGQVVGTAQCNYSHDALGRRLKKALKDENGQERITYFGWDGDRHIHTETLKEDGIRDIVHTVYEPDSSFTPMVRLSATLKGDPQAKPHFMVQALQAGLTLRKNNISPHKKIELAQLQKTLSDLPEELQKKLERNMRDTLERAKPGQVISELGGGLDGIPLLDMVEGLKVIKQEEQSATAIHFFHCDHLGTPLALTDREGNIAWAARRDPFGNLIEEYNPNEIEQNIGLPGQYHDREIDLYYNRHRYYDPKIGAYINQDPIGLMGGMNEYIYPNNPIVDFDPMGLAALTSDQIRNIVAGNNKSGLPNETIECLIWKESGFNPAIHAAGGTTAVGLMQVEKGAVDYVKRNIGSLDGVADADIKTLSKITYAGMTDAQGNVAAGTAYLGLIIQRKAGGDISTGMDKFGTGPGYSKSINACSKCLQDARNSSLVCKDEQKCFNMIHK
jgi:RHS repeat-associated protein